MWQDTGQLHKLTKNPCKLDDSHIFGLGIYSEIRTVPNVIQTSRFFNSKGKYIIGHSILRDTKSGGLMHFLA